MSRLSQSRPSKAHKGIKLLFPASLFKVHGLSHQKHLVHSTSLVWCHVLMYHGGHCIAVSRWRDCQFCELQE